MQPEILKIRHLVYFDISENYVHFTDHIVIIEGFMLFNFSHICGYSLLVDSAIDYYCPDPRIRNNNSDTRYITNQIIVYNMMKLILCKYTNSRIINDLLIPLLIFCIIL